MNQQKRKWHKRYGKQIFCVFLLGIFFFIAEDILDKEVFSFDQTVTQFMKEIHSPPLTNFFKTITHLASGYLLISITALSFILVKNKRWFYIIIVNLFNTVVLNQGLKIFFARERPQNSLIAETGYSFPSGHSMAAMAFYGFLIYILYQRKISKLWKTIWITILGLIIILIGISRIYLGVHYTSDVIGGFCLSLSYLIIFVSILSKYFVKE